MDTLRKSEKNMSSPKNNALRLYSFSLKCSKSKACKTTRLQNDEMISHTVAVLGDEMDISGETVYILSVTAPL